MLRENNSPNAIPEAENCNQLKSQNNTPPLSRSLLWLITIAAGWTVANNYYNQPLLGIMGQSLNVAQDQISQVAMITQIGFALGLLFIVPLGDKIQRKKLIIFAFFGMVISLLAMAIANSLPWLLVASFLIGFTSVVPQLLVPLAAELATPQRQSSAIGMVMSGLLLGILLSRVVSGIVGDLWGWRTMYYLAASWMVILAIMLFYYLPNIPPNFKGSYSSLMKSIVNLTISQPVLRLAAFRGAMGFAGFSAFWTAIVFHLEQPPFNAGSTIAGAFGLVGAIGALAAATVGKISRKIHPNHIILGAIGIMIFSWITLYIGAYYYIGLILGVILLDFGLQSMHIMNQSTFFALNIGAGNRLNTVYMFSYFVGGSTGTFLASKAWKYAQWDGVVFVGFLFTLIGLIAHLYYTKLKQKC